MNANENHGLEDKALDLLLHQAFAEITAEEMEEYQSLAEKTPEIPTPGLDRAMKKKKFKERRKTILRYGAVAAAVIVILLGTHLTLYNSVEAYRVQFQNIFVEYDEGSGGFGSIQVTDNNQKGGIVEVSRPTEDFPFAMWFPDGYEVTFVDDYSIRSGYLEFTNQAGDRISFDYILHENNALGVENYPSIGFDTEDSEIKDIDIRGNQGVSILRRYLGDTMHKVMWADENYIFSIDGTYDGEDYQDSEDLQMTIARSLVYDVQDLYALE